MVRSHVQPVDRVPGSVAWLRSVLCGETNAFRKWTADGDWGPHAERRRTSEGYWKRPFSWAKWARQSGTRPRVFCASLADVFDNKAPEGARDDLFRLIRATPELDWLLLTKRPQNIIKMLPPDWGDGYPNVWLGITAEDEEHYRQEIGSSDLLGCRPTIAQGEYRVTKGARVVITNWKEQRNARGPGGPQIGPPPLFRRIRT